MKMKSILMGSAAALGLGGVAQAADLSFAVQPEAVDYVRVCDAFGTGYYYIPGTDTCLKISGYVRVEALFYSPDKVVDSKDVDIIVVEGEDDSETVEIVTEDHYDSYEFHTRGALTFEARSQTDWGPLVAIINLETNFYGNDEAGSAVGVDETLLSLGPFYAGYQHSLFDQIGGGYQLQGLDGFGAISDTKLNTIGLNWNLGGIGIGIAVEDNRIRAEEWLGNASVAGDFPDLVAALMGEWGNLAASVAFLYMDTAGSATWGVQGYVEATSIGIFDLLAGASYLDGGGTWGDAFSFLVSAKMNWSPNLYSAIAYEDDVSCSGVLAANLCGTWNLSFSTTYKPVENFAISGSIEYYDVSDSYRGTLRFQRNFGD